MAIVEREVQVIDEAGVMGLATKVRVFNDSVTGISATEIDTGRDFVTVVLRVGEAPQRRAIVNVESTENGIVAFEVN